MQNRLDDILYDTAEAIFENLAFVLTMPEGEVFGDNDFGLGDFDVENLDVQLNEEAFDAEEDFDTGTHNDNEDLSNNSFLGLDSVAPDNETIVASIHFSGHFAGDLFLETSRDLLPVIGMNMLGLDDENSLTPEEQKDAFKELLNVICGNLLPAVVGDKAVFNIDGAEIHATTSIPETYEGKSPLANAHFGLEVGHATLALFVDQKTWEEKKRTTPSCV